MRAGDPYRVGVFLDYKNVLKDAERAFGIGSEELLMRLSPTRVAGEAVRRSYGRKRQDAVVAFVEVHIALDEPERRDNAALVERWRSEDGPEVLARVRRRRPGREVGVDTACALSCAHAVLDRPPRCEAVLLFCTDLDLRPTTELIGRHGPPDAVKTLSWWAPENNFFNAMPKDRERKNACANIRLDRSVLDASLQEGQPA